jgi:hypothetical protein
MERGSKIIQDTRTIKVITPGPARFMKRFKLCNNRAAEDRRATFIVGTNAETLPKLQMKPYQGVLLNWLINGVQASFRNMNHLGILSTSYFERAEDLQHGFESGRLFHIFMKLLCFVL